MVRRSTPSDTLTVEPSDVKCGSGSLCHGGFKLQPGVGTCLAFSTIADGLQMAEHGEAKADATGIYTLTVHRAKPRGTHGFERRRCRAIHGASGMVDATRSRQGRNTR